MFPRKITTHFTFLVLFVLSFLLRLSLISKGPYHLDSLNLAMIAERSVDTWTLQSQFGPGYPLTVFLCAVFVFFSRLFSQNDPVMAINLMSVVFSSLCIPTLYAIAHKLFGRLAAFLSAVTFSLTPIFLGISLYGKSHVPSIFFLLLGIYGILSFLETRNRKHLLTAGLLIGLMGAARIQDMVLLVIPICYLCLFGITKETSGRTRTELIRDLCLFWAVAAAVLVAFHLPFLLTQSQGRYLFNISRFWQQGIPGNFRGLFSSSLIVSLIFLLKTFTEAGLAVSVIGLILIGRKQPRLFLFLLLWITVPLLFYGNLYTTVPRFLAFLLPPLIIAQGYLLARVMAINPAFRVTVTAIFCTILYLMFASIFPLLYLRHAHALLPDYARWVARTIEPNALLITTDDRLFYEYYGHVKILGRPMAFHSIKDEDLARFQQKLDRALDDRIPVYTTSVGLFAYDPDRKFSSFVKGHYHLDVVGKRLYEDWHRGDLKQRVFLNRLIRLRQKPLQGKRPPSVSSENSL